ncbi:hypothetical protein ACWF5S_03755 [Peribacillus butanolivorans]
MLAVNIATSLTVDETIMDITPPTVFVGQIYSFNPVIIFPIILNGTHKIHIILMIEMLLLIDKTPLTFTSGKGGLHSSFFIEDWFCTCIMIF